MNVWDEFDLFPRILSRKEILSFFFMANVQAAKASLVISIDFGTHGTGFAYIDAAGPASQERQHEVTPDPYRVFTSSSICKDFM